MRIFLPVIVAVGALGVAAAPPTEDSDGVSGTLVMRQLAFEASAFDCGVCDECGDYNKHENPLSSHGTWDGVSHGCNGVGSTCGWPEHEEVCDPQDMDDLASPVELEAIWPALMTGTAEQLKPILARYANVVFNQDRAAIQVSAACRRDRIIVSVPLAATQLESLTDDSED